MSIRFGSALRVLRTARGLSLRGLARKLNVSPAYLSQVENGKLPAPSHERILELAATLDVPPHRLFAQASKIPPNVTQLLERTPEAARFLTRADQLDFPSQGFHKLVEALERLGPDAFMEALELAAPTASPDEGINGQEGIDGGKAADFALGPHLHPSLLFVDLELGAWADVIDTLAEAITELTEHIDPDDIATPLTEGEYPESVCIGGGVAIPYLALEEVERPLVAVARLAEPISTGADPELRLVFLLVGSPRPEIRNLRHLARIVQICTSAETRLALEATATAQELYDVLLAADEALQ